MQPELEPSRSRRVAARGGPGAGVCVCGTARGPADAPQPSASSSTDPPNSGWAGGFALWLLAKLCLHRARATAAARLGQMEPGAAVPRCGQAGLCPSLYEGAGTCCSLHCHPMGCRQLDTSPRCQNTSPSWQDGWVWSWIQPLGRAGAAAAGTNLTPGWGNRGCR